jgi:hypothetical protein
MSIPESILKNSISTKIGGVSHCLSAADVGVSCLE